jgi:hypothetical protein
MVAPKHEADSVHERKSRGWLYYLLTALLAFLAGLIPMWLANRSLTEERDAISRSLRASRTQDALASAIVDARRGEYEPARQAASDFFRQVSEDLDRIAGSPYSDAQKEQLRGLLTSRDDLITLLARSDPASADRLSEIFLTFRQVAGPVIRPASGP